MARSISLSRILNAYNEARGDGREVPRLCLVGTGVEQQRVLTALSAGADGAAHLLTALEAGGLVPAARMFDAWDVIVFVAAGTDPRQMAPLLTAARNSGRGVVALVRGHEDDAWLRTAVTAGDEIARAYGPDADSRPTLENRLVHITDHRAAILAANLPAVRKAYCDHVILSNAKQNGVIGVVVVIPGADMPAMTANQIRMVLQIAAAYGEEIGFDRALEILSVIGSGFVFRALARQALTFVPGFGWAVKGAVGMSATLALGRAAVAYFERGAPLQVSHMKRVKDQVDRLRSRLPGHGDDLGA